MTWLSSDRYRLEKFRKGDKEVFANVYSVYKTNLARSLVNGFSVEHRGKRILIVVRSAFELDDIIQQTFLKAFSEKSRRDYDGVRPFGAWLKAIARNLAIDRYRILSRYSYDEVYETVEVKMNQEIGESYGYVSPEEVLFRKERSQIYERFITGLKGTDRLLVKMRFEEQFTREEVTRKTGLSAMQIRYREKKLFLDFRKLFDDANAQVPPLDQLSWKRKEKKR